MQFRQIVGVEYIQQKSVDHTSNDENRSSFLALESVAVVVGSRRTPDFDAWPVFQHLHYFLHSRLHSMCEGGSSSSTGV